MASTGGREGAAVERDPIEAGQGCGFEAAMLLLRRAGMLRDGPDGLRDVSFVPDLGHAYPTEECALERADSGSTRVTVRTPFFGLLGSMGALPIHLSAWVQERVKEGDRAALDFLALFHERLVTLFLQAHIRHRFWVRFAWDSARPPGEPALHEDPFQEAVFGLLGLAAPESRLQCGLPPLALLYHAGQLLRRPCSISGVESVLADYFDAPVRIRPFQGGWVPIPAESRSGLGAAPIGESFALGDRYFDPADRFRIELGPLNRELFEELMPGARGAMALAGLVRFAVGPGQRFDYVLALRSEDVPAARLGASAAGPRLGQSFWTQSADVEQVRWAGPFEPEPIEEHRGTGLAA